MFAAKPSPQSTGFCKQALWAALAKRSIALHEKHWYLDVLAEKPSPQSTGEGKQAE